MDATAHLQPLRRPKRRQGNDPVFPRLLGERLCLDFANSIEDPRADEPQDFLHTHADLVRWGRHVGLVSDAQVPTLTAQVGDESVFAEQLLGIAMSLRGAITRVFTAVARQEEPTGDDLATVQAIYSEALVEARLVPVDERFQWRWNQGEQATVQSAVLWPVAASAIELLTHDDLGRVKQCSGPDGCDWLFYDTSKNGSRRWCSMEGCGSRAKMRRYNARKRRTS
jgi:predicted RNA-binding Zn ribbon-like protein